ncbi:MAG: hypothetical protein KIT33_02780 [Candidatus Kapabacteria bacterium]|nr:hypothetical protein [Ignavibacteriota bacterium]MCW5883874.1 hypothetical protein [Candidatus Kapabacteria bacterium]
MHLVEILVPFFFFAFTFGSIFIYVTSNHREKMALIERGVDTEKFYNRKDKNTYLRFGFLLFGGGFGFIIGMLIAPYFSQDEEGIILSSTLLFSGAFIILSYVFEMKYLKKSNASKEIDVNHKIFTED